MLLVLFTQHKSWASIRTISLARVERTQGRLSGAILLDLAAVQSQFADGHLDHIIHELAQMYGKTVVGTCCLVESLCSS